MGTRLVYDYQQQKWIPYVSDTDVIMIVQIHNGARREEERVRRREEGGYSAGTVRVHWGTVRVQLGYSGIRREEERVRRRREGGYIEGTGRIQWGVQ